MCVRSLDKGVSSWGLVLPDREPSDGKDRRKRGSRGHKGGRREEGKKDVTQVRRLTVHVQSGLEPQWRSDFRRSPTGPRPSHPHSEGRGWRGDRL